MAMSTFPPRVERLLWLVVRADALGSGAMVLLTLVAVPVLALLGAPRTVLLLAGLLVIAGAVVLSGLGAVTAWILATARGDIGIPAGAAELPWPGARAALGAPSQVGRSPGALRSR